MSSNAKASRRLKSFLFVVIAIVVEIIALMSPCLVLGVAVLKTTLTSEPRESSDTEAFSSVDQVILCLLSRNVSAAIEMMCCSKTNLYPLNPSETNQFLLTTPFTPKTVSDQDIPMLEKFLRRFNFNDKTCVTFYFKYEIPSFLFLNTIFQFVPSEKRQLLVFECFNRTYFEKISRISESLNRLKETADSDLMVVTSSKSEGPCKMGKFDFSDAGQLLQNINKSRDKKKHKKHGTVVIVLHTQLDDKQDKVAKNSNKSNSGAIFDAVNESSEEVFYFLKLLSGLSFKRIMLVLPDHGPIEVVFLKKEIHAKFYPSCIQTNEKGKIVMPATTVSEMFDQLMFVDYNEKIPLAFAKRYNLVPVSISKLFFLANPKLF